jgi:DNA-directed RNA polymerase subunit beta'
VRRIASERDQKVIAAKQKEAEAALALQAPVADADDVFGSDQAEAGLVHTPEGGDT